MYISHERYYEKVYTLYMTLRHLFSAYYLVGLIDCVSFCLARLRALLWMGKCHYCCASNHSLSVEHVTIH